MNLTPFIEHIQDNCPAFSRRVFGAIELSKAVPSSMKMPCAFIVPMSERASENTLTGGFSQRFVVQFGIVICVANQKADKGATVQTELEAVRAELFNAILGFETADTAPVDFVAGQLGDIDGLHTRWHDVFTTSYYFRKI